MTIDLTKLWEAMPPDVQRKISMHDLRRIIDNYNETADEPPRKFDPTAILKEWATSNLRQVRVNVTARELVKLVEGTTDEFRRNGVRLKDTDAWCFFYSAVRKLDEPTKP